MVNINEGKRVSKMILIIISGIEEGIEFRGIRGWLVLVRDLFSRWFAFV